MTTTSDAALKAALAAAPPDAGAVLTIDMQALAENWRLLADRSAPAACAAVVKADAYGLGAVPVGRALWRAGCRSFFVAHTAEGAALRDALPEAEIAVLHGALPGTEDEMAARRLVPVLNDLPGIDRWTAAARRLGRPLRAFIHIDTGMNRLGLTAADVAALAADPSRLSGVALAGWMSHLACPDEDGHPLTGLQLRRFRQAVAKLPPAPLSLASSSAIFRGRDLLFDLTRPGAALYGVNPTPETTNPMGPVVGLHARILQVRDVAAGEAVGYGAAFTAPSAMRAATLSVGYADGVFRALGNKGMARIGGHPAPFIGRVSMDLLSVDATRVPPSALHDGAFATLIGPGRDVDAVAAEAGTIGYEILAALGRRYHRVYLGDSNGDTRG